MIYLVDSGIWRKNDQVYELNQRDAASKHVEKKRGAVFSSGLSFARLLSWPPTWITCRMGIGSASKNSWATSIVYPSPDEIWQEFFDCIAPMDLYVGAIAISNICFPRGTHSWAYFYEMHAYAFIRYKFQEYLVTIRRKSFSTHPWNVSH